MLKPTIFIAACVGGCVWLRLRRMEAGGVAPTTRSLLREVGWRVGLLAATLTGFALFGHVQSEAAFLAVAVTGLVAVVAPVPRGPLPDLAAAGLVLLGLGMIALAVRAAYGYDLPVSTPLAALAGIQGGLILACGLWLAPRTSGGHARRPPRPEGARLAGPVPPARAARPEADPAGLAELERHLRGGTQPRLVAVDLSLRAAQRLMDSSPQAAVALVAEAREAAEALAEAVEQTARALAPGPAMSTEGPCAPLSPRAVPPIDLTRSAAW